MKRLIIALLLAGAIFGAARAAECAHLNMIRRIRIENPCFDTTGKWFTR